MISRASSCGGIKKEINNRAEKERREMGDLRVYNNGWQAEEAPAALPVSMKLEATSCVAIPQPALSECATQYFTTAVLL